MQKSRLEQLLNFLKENPEDDFLNYALAMEYIGLADTDKALKLLQNLQQKSPDYLATYYQLGKILEQRNEILQALIIYQKGLEIAIAQKEKRTASELQSAIDLLD